MTVKVGGHHEQLMPNAQCALINILNAISLTKCVHLNLKLLTEVNLRGHHIH